VVGIYFFLFDSKISGRENGMERMENKDVINHIYDAHLAAVLFTRLTACLTEILPATPEWNKH